MKLALDTNILAYAEGVNGAAMRDRALRLLSRLPPQNVVLPVQVLGELFLVLLRKARRSPEEARSSVLHWSNSSATLVETTAEVMIGATDLVVTHQLSFWDSVVLCAAAEANCGLLLSEDMQDGLVSRGVTVVNPFAAKPHPLLTAALSAKSH